MPHLVQMDKRLGKKGLQIIGAHVQGGNNEDVAKKAKSLKMDFPVTKGITGPRLSDSIPSLLIFDVTGKLVFSGHPMSDSEKVIKKELKKVTLQGEDATEPGSFGLPNQPKSLSEMRDWTNAEGKTITAELAAINGDKVTLKLKSGKSVDYPIEKLSEEDQTFIASKKEDAEN